MQKHFLKIAFVILLVSNTNLLIARNSKPKLEIDFNTVSKKTYFFYSCLSIALNQMAIWESYSWANWQACNSSPGPTSGCMTMYINQLNAGYAIIEANLNSCEGVQSIQP